MATNIKCTNCGIVLDEDPSESSEKRKPCPNCGSKERTFYVAVSGRLTFTDTVTVTKEVIPSTNLVLKAVIVPSEKTDEGQIIIAVTLPWFDIIELLKDDPGIAFKIPSRKWEEIIAGAYKKAGFDDVTLTPRSGDLGRDIIAIKRGLGSVRVIDQVKAYKQGHLVTADDVRALIGVLEGDKASKGFLTTTSDFAPTLKDDPLIKPFIPSQIELINGEELLNRLEELSVKKMD